MFRGTDEHSGTRGLFKTSQYGARASKRMETCGMLLLTSCHVVCAAKSVVPANKSFATMTAIRFGRNPQRTAPLKVIVVPPRVFCPFGSHWLTRRA
jgi:hypothetical protein